MPTRNKLVKLKIEKLSNLGFGIAKHNGIVTFIANTCPGDEVVAEIVRQNKNYSIAKVVDIVNSSPFRVTPPCSLQKICGACQLQFIAYDYQLKLKKQIIEDAMRSIYAMPVEVRDVVPIPVQWECRRKIQYAVRASKNSTRLKIGYFRNNSHELINIKHCPIQPEVCNDIVNYIRENAQFFSVTGYNEHTHSGDLRHLVIRSSADNNSVLLTLVINSQKLSSNLGRFAKSIYEKFPCISGVCVNFNTSKSNLILGSETKQICGNQFIKEKICDIEFQIEPNTFFQVNPKSAENIFRFVQNHISTNFTDPEVLDAYAGITAFGIVLAGVSKKVTSVEECLESVKLAQRIIERHGFQNIELNHMDAEKFFESCIENGRTFDVVILDPPRKGCTEQSLRYAIKLARRQIIYVSCNPATLARDLKILTELGARVRYIQPFDMFCHTYHVESVAIIDLNPE